MLCSFPTGILQCCLKKWNVLGFVRSDCNFPVNHVSIWTEFVLQFSVICGFVYILILVSLSIFFFLKEIFKWVWLKSVLIHGFYICYRQIEQWISIVFQLMQILLWAGRQSPYLSNLFIFCFENKLIQRNKSDVVVAHSGKNFIQCDLI